MYLSGLPGTGKSLTAFEIVRQCLRHVQPGKSRCVLPPALIAINCMALTHPKQVIERILAGHQCSCRQKALGRGSASSQQDHDPLIQFHAGDGVGEQAPIDSSSAVYNRRMSHGGTASVVSDALFSLRQLVLQPLPADDPQSQQAQQDSSQMSSQTLRETKIGKSGSKGHGSRGRRLSTECQERGMVVVILDELDGLLTGKHGEELVGGLFSLASLPNSRLVLIGIANSIDLVQRLLRPGGPFHRYNLRPAHEVFPAYGRAQVSALLHQRLGKLPGPVFQMNTIEFCARKISNGAGDLRLALEAMSLAIDAHVDDLDANTTSEKNRITMASDGVKREPERVGMRHMAKALSQVTGGIGVKSDIVASIQQLPVPQQLLMVAIAKLLGEKLQNRGLQLKLPSNDRRKSLSGAGAAHFIGSGNGCVVSDLLPVTAGNASTSLKTAHRRRSSQGGFGSIDMGRKDLTLGDIECAHAELCKRVGVTQYNGSEFVTASEMVSTLGLVEFVGKGDMRQKRVVLRVPEDDILMALADKPVLKDVVGA